MRIALLALHFAEYSLRLALALAREHQVLLVLEAGNAEAELGPDFRRHAGPALEIATVRHERSLAAAWRNARRLRQLVRSYSPDVIHLQEASTEFVVGAALSLRRYRQVLTVHDPSPHSGEEVRSLSTLRHMIGRRLLRANCDAAVTHGSALATALAVAVPRLQGRIVSVPHGPLGNGAIAGPWEPGCLLFFGRIQKYKGLRYLVAALEQLQRQGLALKLVVAGRGEDLEPNRAALARLPGVEIHERYIAESEVPGLFARAQLVVLPYTDGTQSGVAALALGYGRPVVASAVGAVGEMVVDGDNGLLVPPCDVPALAAAIRRLVEDQDLARRMARRSRELGETEMSWDRNAAITAAAYRSLLQSPEPQAA
jgi:glycosyltransferase involved in cell wall biosynthesis